MRPKNMFFVLKEKPVKMRRRTRRILGGAPNPRLNTANRSPLRERIPLMSMIVYGGALSPYVARVAIAARYKGMKYTLTPAVGGGQKSPEFLKIHPYGKVPALKDGKTVLF